MAINKRQSSKETLRETSGQAKGHRVNIKTRQVRGHIKLVLQQFLAGFLIFIGFLLIMYAASKNFNFSLYKQVKEAQKQNQIEEKKAYKAVLIAIPKINKLLDITDGTFDGKRWVVSEEGVSYYTQSSLPQQGGNTVLYGHNKAAILGGLTKLKFGDKIELTLNNGDVVVYEVYETKTIKPTDVDILNQTTEPRLTIYTCSGFLDSARFVVLAKPVN